MFRLIALTIELLQLYSTLTKALSKICSNNYSVIEVNVYHTNVRGCLSSLLSVLLATSSQNKRTICMIRTKWSY